MTTNSVCLHSNFMAFLAEMVLLEAISAATLFLLPKAGTSRFSAVIHKEIQLPAFARKRLCKEELYKCNEDFC